MYTYIFLIMYFYRIVLIQNSGRKRLTSWIVSSVSAGLAAPSTRRQAKKLSCHQKDNILVVKIRHSYLHVHSSGTMKVVF